LDASNRQCRGERAAVDLILNVIDPSARIHPSADLERDVHFGPGSSVWHRAQVRTGARIGAECIVGRDAFIDEGVTIGDRVKIQNAGLVHDGRNSLREVALPKDVAYVGVGGQAATRSGRAAAAPQRLS
jgi:carbonic anhydrase/acetyltransferase-like protein (isoleucine patch superfamily)